MRCWWGGLREGVVVAFDWYLRPSPLIGSVGVITLIFAAWDLLWWVAFDNAVLEGATLPALVLAYMCLRGNYWKHRFGEVTRGE